MKIKYEPAKTENVNVEIGCGYCWDKKKKHEKELFFLDAANNMRVCVFCPYCGREYGKVFTDAQE